MDYKINKKRRNTSNYPLFFNFITNKCQQKELLGLKYEKKIVILYFIIKNKVLANIKV